MLEMLKPGKQGDDMVEEPFKRIRKTAR